MTLPKEQNKAPVINNPKEIEISWAWFCATREANLSPGVQDQPGQHNETLSQKN
jgi:hypothetical protein